LALSTANLFAAVQPGGSLFGLQESNPVDISVAYKGPSSDYGTTNDRMVGSKIGGVNVFGGGLALYATNKVIVGGVGVSGDTSSTDHDVAWRVRTQFGSRPPIGVGGVSGDANYPDNIVYDIVANHDGTGGTGQNPAGSGRGDKSVWFRSSVVLEYRESGCAPDRAALTEQEHRAVLECDAPTPDRRGGLNGSLQH